MKRMLFNATHPEELRVCIVDSPTTDRHGSGSRSAREQRKSNIYKGIITRVEPSLEACLVDYGEERATRLLPLKKSLKPISTRESTTRTATIMKKLFPKAWNSTSFVEKRRKEETRRCSDDLHFF